MTTHVDKQQPAKPAKPAPTMAQLKAEAAGALSGNGKTPTIKGLPERKVRIVSRFLRLVSTYTRAEGNLRRAAADAADYGIPATDLLAALDATHVALKAAVDQAA